MNADRIRIYRDLGPGPSCRRPNCGATCPYAYACQSINEGSLLSLVAPVALTVVVLALAAVAVLGG